MKDTNLNLSTIQQFWPHTFLLQVHDLLFATPAKKEEGSMKTGRFSLEWPWPLAGRDSHLKEDTKQVLLAAKVKNVRFSIATRLLPPFSITHLL